MFFPPGIINHHLPEKNKYTNFKNIETYVYSETPSHKLNRFYHFIKLYYLQNKDNIYNPGENNIAPYFIGHNSKALISLYYEDNYLMDTKTNNTIKDEKLVGLITSRPLNVFIKKDNVTMDVYYADYLCVHKNYRKKGIASQLIQTHHYNQSYLNKNIAVSLFKREDELTGIVPLCVYLTYGFSVKKWGKPKELGPMSGQDCNMIEVTEQNLYLLFDFIKNNKSKFDITITCEITNIVELIKTKNIYIYIILLNKTITSAYFYRKSCVDVEAGMEALTCFASINSDNDDLLFIKGFKISFWEIAFKNNFGFCAIENVSHNNIIINNLILKTKPIITSPTAYFFYNFAYPTFKPDKCLILH
jgi:GNAT superfamily N-acetyltransferase